MDVFEEFSSRDNVLLPTSNRENSENAQIFSTRRVDVLFARGVQTKKRQIVKVLSSQ